MRTLTCFKKMAAAIISFLFLCLPFLSEAQTPESGFNHIRGSVVDSLSQEPVAGALITAINSNGALHTVADKDGKFDFFLLKGHGQARLEATMLGYHIARKVLSLNEDEVDAGTFLLQTDPEELEAAIVKGRALVFKQQGDTTIFFPSALLLGRPVSALEALSFMPGVEASQEGVSVQGKQVERTYVNGKLIFGKDDPLAALNNIDAKDVAAILAYDEFDEKSQVMTDHTGRKRKVLNVVTFDLFDQSLVAKVMTSGGADTQKNLDGDIQGRYLVGGGVYFFSERRQLTLDYVGNNVGHNGYAVHQTNGWRAFDPSSYRREHKVLLKYADKIKGTWDISGTYEYDNLFMNQKEIRAQDFFGTDQLAPRSYADTSSSSSKTGKHSATLALSHFGNRSYLDMNVASDWTTAQSNGLATTLLSSEENILNYNSVKEKNEANLMRIAADIDYSLFLNVGSLSAQFHSLYGREKADQNQEQHTYRRELDKVILTSGSDKANYTEGMLNYSLDVGDYSTVSAEYGMDYTYDRKYHLATDEQTGEVDPTLSRNFTDNFLENIVKVNYDFQKDAWELSTALAYHNKGIRRNDELMDLSWKQKTYQSFSPLFKLRWSRNGKQFVFQYSGEAQSPSLEMLSNRLDYRNPMYLSIGNQELRQAYRHYFNMSYNGDDVKRQFFWSVQLYYTLQTDSFGSRSIYLTEDTYLPEYGYTAQKGANLTSFENMDRAHQLIASIYASGYVPMLSSRMSAALRYNYDSKPMYIGEKPVVRVQQTPDMEVSFMSNFSRHFKMQMKYNLAYSYSTAVKDQTYSSLRNEFNLEMKADFAKRMYADASYGLYHDYSLTHKDVLVSVNKLNLEVGCRLFKEHSGTLSLSVSDLLNRDRSFSQSVFADRIESIWKYQTPRFVMLNFTYTFKRSK